MRVTTGQPRDKKYSTNTDFVILTISLASIVKVLEPSDFNPQHHSNSKGPVWPVPLSYREGSQQNGP